MKILIHIIGAVTGGAFGVLASFALIGMLRDGNVVEEAFLILPGVPAGLFVGAFVGVIVAKRVAQSLRVQSTSDSERRRKRWLILALVLGIPTAFVAVVWIDRGTAQPPLDSAMLRHFYRHEAEFDTLVEMVSSDKGLDRVDQDWTMPTDTRVVGVSSERLEDYRMLLRDAGVPRGFQISWNHDGYDFLYWLRGSAISDDTDKGFAYRATPPPGIVESLDGIHPESRNAMIAYRHIRGNWYLFFRFIPD